MTSWRRIFWSGVTAVSLVGCVACAVMWARCFLMPQTSNDALVVWKVEVAGAEARQRVVRVCSHSGALHADYDMSAFSGPPVPTPVRGWVTTPWRAERVASKSVLGGVRGEQVAGFRFWTEQENGRPWGSNHTRDSIGVSVPYWATALGFGALPVVWLRRKRRSDGDRVAGRCAQCGYDLRATPGRCPECGAVAESRGE